MAIVQCKKKHYYDNSKYKECPHCKKMDSPFASSVNENDNLTIAKFHKSNNSVQVAAPEDSQASKGDDLQKTVGIYMQKNNIDPVAGWLVGTQGENRGRSFEIHINNNYVGRSMKNDIKINDVHISREKHLIVTFDPKSVKFYVSPGNGLTYLNGKNLTQAEELHDGDTVKAGESSYVFIPYCNEGRGWDD